MDFTKIHFLKFVRFFKISGKTCGFKQFYPILIVSVFCSNFCFSQSFNIDVGIGTDSQNRLFNYDFNPGIGYSFTDKDYLFAGFKFQTYSLIPKSRRDSNDLWSTTNIHNFLFDAGARYLFPFADRKKIVIGKIGFYPEVKLYFNPYVPRKLKYIDNLENEIKVKGEYDTGFAYSIGLGVYFSNKYQHYGALSFEYSTIDAFKTLRKLNFENENFDFPAKNLFSINLSIFFW